MIIKQILTRVYVNNMDKAISFYENLLMEKCCNRFSYAAANLELATIGSILIISGTDKSLEPFMSTSATFLVDSIVEFRDFLLSNGAAIIRDLTEVPTGINMTVKHFEGTIVEYVEHKNTLQTRTSGG